MERTRILIVAVTVLVVAVAAVFLLRGGGAPEVPGGVGSDPAVDGVPELRESDAAGAGGDRTTVDERPAGGRAPGSVAAASHDTARLEVHLRNAGGAAVPDVEVFVYRHRDASWPPRVATRTGVEGIAWFEGLEPGAVEVESAFGAPRAPAELVAGETTELELPVPSGATVDGLVVDPDGRGIPDARVWLSAAWDDARGGVAARTDERGTFHLDGVGRGRGVAAWAQGFAASPVHPVKGDGERLRIVLSRSTGAVRGTVLDERGRPVRGATVRVGAEERPRDRRTDDGSRIPGPAPREARTAEDGTFAVHHLEPGRHPVGVAADGFAPHEMAVEVTEGGTAEVAVVLLEGASVEGVCRDAQGAGLARVHVEVLGTTRLAARAAVSAGDGCYRLVDVAIGEVEIGAYRGARIVPPVTSTIVTRPGETSRWDPVLESDAVDPASVVSGRVLDPAGQGLEDYRVVAEPEPPVRATPVASRLTARDGTFRVAVPWERVRLLVYEQLAPGAFPVAFADGVARGTSGVELRVDETTFSSIRGRVIDTAGAAVPATLQLWHEDARVFREVVAEPGTGVVELAPVLPGRCTIEVRSADHPWLRLGDKVLPAGGVLDLGELVMQPGGRVEGNVVFTDGGVPTALTLRFADEGTGREVGVAEVRDGRYRSGALPLGNLVMIVEGDGIAATRLPVPLDASTPLRVVDLTVQRGLPVTLRLALPSGMERPQWLNVGIFREREAVWTRGIGRSAALEVTVGLAPGEYRVLVQSGAVLADVPVRVAGQPVTVDVPLRVR